MREAAGILGRVVLVFLAIVVAGPIIWFLVILHAHTGTPSSLALVGLLLAWLLWFVITTWPRPD